MRVLDAFRPQGATWLGQVMSSQPGPSGEPSKTHLLPGGGVPRVHRARSPVPPRLLLFATPRSVHQFAAVAAGAYPVCCPPNAWSPGAPALPGPCYWLVAIGTPLGWRGGCLALGLGRGAVRHYCLSGCSAPSVCARRSRPVRGARAGTRCRVSPVSPFPPRVSRAVCGGPSCPGVPYPRSLERHSTRSVCSESSVWLPFWYSPCAPCVCVRSCSRGVPSPPPPPLVGVARAPRAIPGLGAGRAVPRSPCPSACPAPVPCSVWRALGGGGPVPFPPYLAWGCAPPRGWVCAPRGVGWGWGGGLCAAPPVCAAEGASGAGGCSASLRPSTFPEQATKRVSLASFWSWRAWPPYRSGLCSLAVSGRVGTWVWCAGICWMPGGMHRVGCTSGCGGAPPPVPLPLLRPPPRAPMPRPVCPRGPTAPLPLPLGPFPAPTPLSPCPCCGPRPCQPRSGLHCRRPCPSRARAHALGCTNDRPPPLAPLKALRGRPLWRPARAPACPFRALAPSRLPAPRRAVRCPRSVPLCCCWPRRLACLCALAPCRVCPRPPPVCAPGHSPCRPLSPALRSRGWHSALPARHPPLPGSSAGRPAASAATAA